MRNFGVFVVVIEFFNSYFQSTKTNAEEIHRKLYGHL
jgi:hypothetical protein